MEHINSMEDAIAYLQDMINTRSYIFDGFERTTSAEQAEALLGRALKNVSNFSRKNDDSFVLDCHISGNKRSLYVRTYPGDNPIIIFHEGF